MAQHVNKYSPSKYKHVGHELVNGFEYWFITLAGYQRKRYKTEIEAAKAIDMLLIKQGKEPVNVLKRA